MNWLNEPPEWSQDGLTLKVVTGKEGDYWQKTHYGFVHDDGHFAYERVEGEFTAQVVFEADYQGLYDQAGLMVRFDPEHWIKAGIEFFEGRMNLSVVVTHGHSDWSVRPWTGGSKVWLRLIRRGDALAVQSSEDGVHFELVRLAYFVPEVPVMVGRMTCSPTRSGLVARFGELTIGPTQDFAA